MKILLLGAGGQVGWELQRSLAPLGTVWALGRDAARNPDQLCGDLANLPGLAQTVRALRPDAIVNAAAYTAVDKAESDTAMAAMVNADAPALLAELAHELDAWLVHYSTDYVFEGSGTRPWVETDAAAPINAYGATKWQGEQQVVQQCKKHLILRTSWVYAARGGNFAKTMLRLAATRETLQVIDDQIGAPTGADLLADLTAHMLRAVRQPGGEALAGIYHAAAAGETSWHAYASYVIAQSRAQAPGRALAVQTITPVASSAFASAAKRPLNSRLDTRKLQAAFGLQLPAWQQGVARMLREIDYDAGR